MRLEATLRSDDPADEIRGPGGEGTAAPAAASLDLADANHQRLLLSHSVQVTAVPETTRSWPRSTRGGTRSRFLVVTGATDTRTEAANTSIKHLKRTGRGYRFPVHSPARILLAGAVRSAV